MDTFTMEKLEIPINSMQLRCHLVLGPSVLHPAAGRLKPSQNSTWL